MHRWFVLLALSGALVGCSAATSSDPDRGGSGGSAGNFGGVACTTNPDCGGCTSCFAKCACSTGQTADCANACGGVNPGSGGASAGSGGASPGSGGGGGVAPVGSLAAGVRITEISVNQAVKIPLMSGGVAVTNRNAPVVQGRPAFLRVFVATDAGFQARPIIARLSVAGQADQTVSHDVSGPSSDANLGSSFNFDVPAEQLTGDAAFSVSLEEAGGAPSGGATDGARWPASGTAALGAVTVNGPFRVLAIPITVGGFSPDTSPAHLQALHDALFGMYPVESVSLEVGPAQNSPYALSANGSGWGQTLNWLSGLRASLGVDKKTFLYGMLAPASSINAFCGGGCVAGLGSVPSANDTRGRAAIGLGYFPDGSGGPSMYSTGGATTTMVHELGHALGRNHAPCSPPGAQLQGVDGAYPYQGASIGSWGYDLVGHALKDPGKHTDVLGYCSPSWVSDYTYRGIQGRMAFINASAYEIPSADPLRAPGRFRVAVIEPDGTMQWALPEDTDSVEQGEERSVELRDASGRATGTITGYYTPFADLPGGILRVRERLLTSAHFIAALSVTSTVLPLR